MDPLGRPKPSIAVLPGDEDPEAALRAARQAFEESGGKIVLLNMSWVPTWQEKKALDRLAAKIFGTKARL